MKIMTKTNIRVAAITSALTASLLLAAGCSGKANPGQAQACRNGLDKAWSELKAAEAAGFRGATDIVAASSLLTAAETQEKFGKYPNCINKVQRARTLIRQARQG
jgi:hypothetical protein